MILSRRLTETPPAQDLNDPEEPEPEEEPPSPASSLDALGLDLGDGGVSVLPPAPSDGRWAATSPTAGSTPGEHASLARLRLCCCPAHTMRRQIRPARCKIKVLRLGAPVDCQVQICRCSML